MLRELLVFVVTVCLFNDRVWADQCQHHLNSLAHSQQDFVRCSTLNAVPVKLCTGCKPHYENMTEAFNTLATSPNCSEKYFDKDRINIVSTTQSILTGLWDKVFCDDCFKGNMSNQTDWEIFQSKSVLLQDCFDKNKTLVCVACVIPYQDINKFYKNLDKWNNGKICYDMQDLMNRTRLQWSKDFNCCKREFNMLLFICASSFVAVLPILFYCGSYMYGKRRERNHGVIDADPEVTGPLISEETAPSQQDPIVAPHAQMQQKSLRYETDSSDSDYDHDVPHKKLG